MQNLASTESGLKILVYDAKSKISQGRPGKLNDMFRARTTVDKCECRRQTYKRRKSIVPKTVCS